ncbi:MAG: hypothetical protein AVDCRST_MAG19-1375, partial [uncultured Thermomicrobiales bacterium]
VPSRHRHRPRDHPPAPAERPDVVRRAEPRDRHPGVDGSAPDGPPPPARRDRVRDAGRPDAARLRPAGHDRAQGRAEAAGGDRRDAAGDAGGDLRRLPDRQLRRRDPGRGPLPGGIGRVPDSTPGTDPRRPLLRNLRDALRDQADDRLDAARGRSRGAGGERPGRRRRGGRAGAALPAPAAGPSAHVADAI